MVFAVRDLVGSVVGLISSGIAPSAMTSSVNILDVLSHEDMLPRTAGRILRMPQRGPVGSFLRPSKKLVVLRCSSKELC